MQNDAVGHETDQRAFSAIDFEDQEVPFHRKAIPDGSTAMHNDVDAHETE